MFIPGFFPSAISLLTGFWRGPTLVLVLVWKARLVEAHVVGPHDPRFKEDGARILIFRGEKAAEGISLGA